MDSMSTTAKSDKDDYTLPKQRSISPTRSRYSSPSQRNGSSPSRAGADDAQMKKASVRKPSLMKTDSQEEGKTQSNTKSLRARSAKTEDNYRLQNLEVKHAMLKTELTSANREVSQMAKKLRSYDEEKRVLEIREKDLRYKELNFSIIEKKWHDEIKKLEDEIVELKNNIDACRERSTSEERKEKERNDALNEQKASHQEFTIEILNNNLEKSQKECRKIVNEFEKYKVRVKSMIAAKESEIKLLKKNTNLTEDVKIILEENERLRVECETLEQNMNYLRVDNDDLKVTIQELEMRSCTAERLFSGLRDALKEERMARNKSEKECIELNTQIKCLRQETDDTIAELRSTLYGKKTKEGTLKRDDVDESINAVKAVTSSTDVSNRGTDIVDNKIEHLTQTLIQTQNSIEMLLSDTLKMQYGKKELKDKKKMADIRPSNRIDKHDKRKTIYTFTNLIDYILRNPVLCVFSFIYLVGLHMMTITSYLSSQSIEERSRNVPVAEIIPVDSKL